MSKDAPPPYALVGPQSHQGVLLSTVNDFAGYDVKLIYGLVYGTYVTRSGMGLMTKEVDGEFVKMREQTVLAREKAAERLIDGIVSSGGNAACGMRFDISYVNQTTIEVTCYGTAVRIVPHEA